MFCQVLIKVKHFICYPPHEGRVWSFNNLLTEVIKTKLLHTLSDTIAYVYMGAITLNIIFHKVFQSSSMLFREDRNITKGGVQWIF